MSKKIVGINLIPKWKDWHNKYCYIAEVEEIEEKPRITPLEWFTIKNPLLGGVSPVDMIKAGRERKLCKFILNAVEENALPLDYKDEPKTIGESMASVSKAEGEYRRSLTGFEKPKETLKEKFKCCDMKNVTPKQLEIIAQVYYQEHPEEIGCIRGNGNDSWYDVCRKNGTVSIDKVLEVFDGASGERINWSGVDKAYLSSHIRTALKGMGETKKIKREGDESEYVRKSEVLVAFDNARLNTFVKGSNKEDGLNFIRDILVANF